MISLYNSQSVIEEITLTIGEENIYGFINKLLNSSIKSKSLCKLATDEVFNQLKSKNFSMPSNEVAQTLIDSVIDCIPDSRLFYPFINNLLTTNYDLFRKLLKTKVIYNEKNNTQNFQLIVNTGLAIEQVGSAIENYNYADAITVAEITLAVVILPVILDVLHNQDLITFKDKNIVNNKLKIIPSCFFISNYSETIRGGLMHPSLISCEIDLGYNYTDLASQFHRLSDTREKLMVKSNDEYKTEAFTGKKLSNIPLFKGFKEYSKKPFIAVSTLKSKGILSIEFADSRLLSYCLQKQNNTPVIKCEGIEAQRSIYLRLLPVENEPTKMKVTMQFPTNQSYARLNYFSIVKQDVSKLRIYEAYNGDIPSPIQVFIYLINITLKSNGIAIDNNVDFATPIIRKFIDKYKTDRNGLVNALSVIQLANLPKIKQEELINKYYTKQNTHQKAKLRAMIKEYKRKLSSNKKVDRLAEFINLFRGTNNV